MARIRTIKPEFPQSESMGLISRDARLLFIMLWTIVDDSGRTRAASRMLASLLYPYDSDAMTLVEGWLSELESERCIHRYVVNGHSYLEICNWIDHQKIDKPSKSKFPSFDESSRILANPRERSSGDQGSRTEGSEDQGRDHASTRDEDDIGATAESQPVTGADRWHMESRQPWAMAMTAARCKIGHQSWPAWKSLCDEFGVELVAMIAKRDVPAGDRWASNTETAIKAHITKAKAREQAILDRKAKAQEVPAEAPRRESAQEGCLRRLAGKLNPVERATVEVGRWHVDGGGMMIKGPSPPIEVPA